MKKQKCDFFNGSYWKIPLCMFAFSVLSGAFGIVRADGIHGEATVERFQQQKMTVKGVVVDDLGVPVIGANVVEKGTTNGTITDVDGNFTLAITQNAPLEVSFIGYITQTIAVRGEFVNVTLKEDSQALDEVVITGFGLSQKKATLTGAISSIGEGDLSRSVSSTASGALVGKLAGVNSRQVDGRPGASTSIEIRNMGNPLFVIDGIQSTTVIKSF